MTLRLLTNAFCISNCALSWRLHWIAF